MRKRRWLLILVIIFVAAAGYFSMGDQAQQGQSPPFADLNRALGKELKQGWKVSVPPKREGPYRIVPGNRPIVPKSSEEGLNYRLRTPDGAVEEIQLVGSKEYEQLILELETQDGHRTLVGLNRGK